MKWLLSACVAGAAAFPNLMGRDYSKPGCTTSALCDKYIEVSDAEAHIPAQPNIATKASAARSNCGALGTCDTFDAASQYVSTTGDHAWQSPSASDVSQ